MKNIYLSVAVFLAATLFVVLVVYLTPLKHLNIIEPTINDISPAEFYELFRENPEDYVFIDVRPSFAYDEKHAEGSINIPLFGLYTEREFLPKRDQTIALICTGGSASGVGYSYLEHYGFLNLLRIGGGNEAWEEAGLPVVTQ